MPLTDEQRIARRTGIGGSDVAAILGLSPWRSAYDVWLTKTSEEELPDDVEDNDAILFGHLLEPVVRDEFARRMKKQVTTSDTVFRHKEKPFLIANVDGLIVGESAGLEVKTASEYMAENWGEEMTDQIPQYYLTQVVHYIGVMGWERCYVAVLIGGNKMRIYVVERDEDAIATLFALEEEFWIKHVVAKVAPPRSIAMLNEAWTKTTGKQVQANEDIFAVEQAFAAIKVQIAELTTQKEDYERRIKEFMQDSDELVFGGKKLATWRFNKPSLQFNEKRFKEEHPDEYAKYMENMPGPRVLRTYK